MIESCTQSKLSKYELEKFLQSRDHPMRHTYCREVGIAPAKDNVSFSDFEVLSNGLT